MYLDSTEDIRLLLRKLYSSIDGPGGTFVRLGMAVSELQVLCSLVQEHGCRNALEIGMAHGTSTVAMLRGMEATGGTLTSVDPFQHSMCGGAGLAAVSRSGMSDRHSLIEEPDYLALPRMLEEGRRFDFVFIDGDHSFDFAFLDFYYADLLLDEGRGVVAFHDTSLPGVYATTQWVERHKPYERIGPKPRCELNSSVRRAWRRLSVYLRGEAADFNSRRTTWRTLAAYRKMRSCGVPQETPLCMEVPG